MQFGLGSGKGMDVLHSKATILAHIHMPPLSSEAAAQWSLRKEQTVVIFKLAMIYP